MLLMQLVDRLTQRLPLTLAEPFLELLVHDQLRFLALQLEFDLPHGLTLTLVQYEVLLVERRTFLDRILVRKCLADRLSFPHAVI